jgi:hypothetical protein
MVETINPILEMKIKAHFDDATGVLISHMVAKHPTRGLLRDLAGWGGG